MTATVNLNQKTNALGKAWDSGDDNKVVEELRKVKSPDDAPIDSVVEILRQTNSSKVRDAAAIALADMRAPDTARVLAEILAKPDVKSCGTLLYAIEEVGGKIPIDILIDTIRVGSYEARQEAVRLITSGKAEFRHGQLQTALVALRALSPQDDEQADAIRRAIQKISALNNRNLRQGSATTKISAAHLASGIAAHYQIPKAKVEAVIKELVGFLIEQLKSGKQARLQGFGSFTVRHRPARTGRKSKKGNVQRAKQHVVFRASNRLKELVGRK